MPIPRANLLSWHSNLLPTTAHDQLGRGKMPLLSSCDENSRTKLLNVVGNSTVKHFRMPKNTAFPAFRAVFASDARIASNFKMQNLRITR